MTILLFSALLLLIILLIKYLARKKRNVGLKLLVVFGIIIGLMIIGLNSLFDDAFGASTPVNIRTENLTDKKLKIYAITFWSNNWNGTGNFVTYDKELEPKKKSDFWFESDGTSEFWIVGKNENNGIDYLNVITENESQFDFKITENQNIDQGKILIAEELTSKTDKNEQFKRFTFWTNIILIGLLILSLIKLKTGGNKTATFHIHKH